MLDDLGELTSLVEEELLTSLRLVGDPASLSPVDLHDSSLRSGRLPRVFRPDAVAETAAIGGNLRCVCSERLVERALRNLIETLCGTPEPEFNSSAPLREGFIW